MLSAEEKYRYGRHLRIQQVGESGQEKLKAAAVLVIGAGGLGCPALMYLAAAGVGKIGIIDYDLVNESNLQRQVIFTTEDVGKNKAIAASERLHALNPYLVTETYPFHLVAEDALDLFRKYDIIVDCSDNFSTRYMVNDASLLTGKPLVYGSVYKFEGQVSVFNFKEGPSYRCLFPDPAKNIPSCEEVGVIGALCGIIGAKQANEVVKIILNLGNTLSGRLEVFRSLTSDTLMLKVKRNPKEIKRVYDMRHSFDTFDYSMFCEEEKEVSPTISGADFLSLLKANNVQVLDVRDEWEEPKLNYQNLVSLPMQDIDLAPAELQRTTAVVVICQHGNRSMNAVNYLRSKYDYRNVVSLENGIEGCRESLSAFIKE
jgi:sulfur-carrier protein adenylyltransferase/sulfurtransferase